MRVDSPFDPLYIIMGGRAHRSVSVFVFVFVFVSVSVSVQSQSQSQYSLSLSLSLSHLIWHVPYLSK